MKRGNKYIKTLTIANATFDSSMGLLSPVIAIFFTTSIIGGTPAVAGTAVAITLIVKSILRVPLAYFLDKTSGEKTEFYVMIAGYILISFSFFLYLFARVPMHVYLIQVIIGISMAMAYTPWYGFFSRHLDKTHEDFEWSIATSLGGLGAALAAFVGGLLVNEYGFSILFIISGLLSFLGVFALLFLNNTINKGS